MQFCMLHSKLDTNIDSVSVDPTVGVAVTIKLACEVPVGRVPSIVSYEESKEAQKGIDVLPDRVAVYETGKHREDAAELNDNVNGDPSCTETVVRAAVMLREQVGAGAASASLSESPVEALETEFVFVESLIPEFPMAMSEVAKT